MKKIYKLLFGIAIEKSISSKRVILKKEQNYSREELKDILDRLYRCRDLEISNLWQRSIFLSVFIVLCFTGYGYLLLQIICSTTKQCCTDENQIYYLNIAVIVLGCVSCIFSILWICMAKSSKAWYEVYETAISNFESNYSDILKIPKDNIMGEMGLYWDKMSSCLYSAKAGAYSPSKINIAIGQVCFSIWLFVIAIHSIFLIENSIPLFLLPILILIVSIIMALRLTCSKWIKSGHLSKYIYDKQGKCVGKFIHGKHIICTGCSEEICSL